MKKPRPRSYPRDFACFCRSNTKFGTKVKCLHYPLLPVLHSILWPFEIKRKIASSSCWTRYWIENPHSIDWGRKVRDYRFPDQQAVDLCDWRFHYAKGTRSKKVGIFLGGITQFIALSNTVASISYPNILFFIRPVPEDIKMTANYIRKLEEAAVQFVSSTLFCSPKPSSPSFSFRGSLALCASWWRTRAFSTRWRSSPPIWISTRWTTTSWFWAFRIAMRTPCRRPVP